MVDDNKIRLQDKDWELLFPEKEYTLGATKIVLRPLTLGQLAYFKQSMATIAPKLEKKGITRANYDATENIIFIAGLLIDVMPGLLSELTRVHEEDITSLPLDALVNLVKVLIDMNLEAKEGLEKNFKALGVALEGILSGGSETQSTNLSQQDTGGRISKSTPKAK